MVKDVIKETAAQKTLYATTAGILTTSYIESEQGAYTLAVVGIFVSLLSYIYDFVHTEKIKTNTKLQTLMEVIKHVLFGAFAMPSIVIEAGRYTDKVQTQLLIGVFVIWSIIYIYEAIKNRLIEFIKDFKK